MLNRHGLGREGKGRRPKYSTRASQLGDAASLGSRFDRLCCIYPRLSSSIMLKPQLEEMVGDIAYRARPIFLKGERYHCCAVLANCERQPARYPSDQAPSQLGLL